MAHPLLELLHGAAHGRFPKSDGGVTLLPALPNGTNAVVAFTGHACICTDLTAPDLADLAIDGYGSAQAPEVLLRLARGGIIDVIDMTMVAAGLGDDLVRPALAPVGHHDDHPRVRYARSLRSGVVVHGDERGFVTLADGLAGRREMSVELLPGAPAGSGRALIEAARHLVPADQPIFAAVAPGNARSARAFLAAGFLPICSEVIITLRR